MAARSGYDIRRDLIVQKSDTVAQHEFALLEPLQLKLVYRADSLQGGNGSIQIAVLPPQDFYLLHKCFLLIVGQVVGHGSTHYSVSARSGIRFA
jgi:hypothetical protein